MLVYTYSIEYTDFMKQFWATTCSLTYKILMKNRSFSFKENYKSSSFIKMKNEDYYKYFSYERDHYRTFPQTYKK